MSAERSDHMILAIGVCDDFLHVYDSDQALLADDEIGAGANEQTGALEFFDSDGYRLAGEYDQQWRLRRLTRAADSSDLSLVRQRVQNCIDHVKSYIKSHPEDVESSGMTVDGALARCPDLGGSLDFATALRALVAHAEPGVIVPADKRDSFSHNWAHTAGWNHG